MEYQEDLGFQIRTLSHLVKRTVDQTAFAGEENHPTGVQGWIIGYLYENRGKEVFQRDIQAQFSIRRSTVTGILQLMEKNGLITRSSVERDARLKKLELTPPGHPAARAHRPQRPPGGGPPEPIPHPPGKARVPAAVREDPRQPEGAFHGPVRPCKKQKKRPAFPPLGKPGALFFSGKWGVSAHVQAGNGPPHGGDDGGVLLPL